jgi:hypothetical protein
VLFRHAGLDIGRFTPVASNRVPPVPTEERGTWEGTLPDGHDTPVRLEAGAYAGRPVYFEIIAPWTDERFGPSFRFRIAAVTVVGTLLIWSAIVARRNVRLGRADRRRAFRSAVVMSLSSFIANGLFLHDMWELTPIVGRGLVFAWACANGIVFWTLYTAAEPYVRRLWPEMLVGWSRLLSGRLRDPLVGRDVLVGTLAGIVATATMHLNVLVNQQAGLPPPLLVPWSPPVLPALVMGGRFAASVVPGTLFFAVGWGLFVGTSLVLLTVILRGRLRGAVALSLFLTLQTFASGVGTGSPLDLAFAGIPAIISVIVLVRFGLLAVMVHFVPRLLLTSVALHFGSAAPYVASSYMLVAIVVAMAFYGFHAALDGRTIFSDTIFREQPRAVR